LGADVSRGKNQKPFNQEIDYDYIMWIDSDIIFNFKQFIRLLNYKKDICSGLYLMQGGRNFACVKNWDEEFFSKNGHFQFLSPRDIQDEKSLLKVNYVGMGWMLVKKGVFESLEYPWFEPIRKQIGDTIDFTMEDVAFCHKAIEKGYEIFVDPKVIVGHEKTVVL
jgi:GT2 family glycosyltransferase